MAHGNFHARPNVRLDSRWGVIGVPVNIVKELKTLEEVKILKKKRENSLESDLKR